MTLRVLRLEPALPLSAPPTSKRSRLEGETEACFRSHCRTWLLADFSIRMHCSTQLSSDRGPSIPILPDPSRPQGAWAQAGIPRLICSVLRRDRSALHRRLSVLRTPHKRCDSWLPLGPIAFLAILRRLIHHSAQIFRRSENRYVPWTDPHLLVRLRVASFTCLAMLDAE